MRRLLKAAKHPVLVWQGKFSEPAADAIEEIIGGVHKAHGREVLQERRGQIYALIKHSKLNRANLPDALQAAHATTLGSVAVILEHPKATPEMVPAAAKVMIRFGPTGPQVEGGYPKVMHILNHPKTTPENARVFLEAAGKHDYESVLRMMDADGVDERNILEKLERMNVISAMAQKQFIKLPKPG